MFVSTECFRRNPKQFIYDKSLPKGNKSEMLVSLFLEHSVNPKGKLAYKLFSTMTEEKRFVDDSQQAVTTPFCAVNYHTQNFYKAIDDFFAFAHTHDYQEVNNEMLNTYLERALNEDDEYCHKHIQSVVFMATFQNKFLTQLKETWLLYKKFTNPKIENV